LVISLLESFDSRMDVPVVMEFAAKEAEVDVAQGDVGIYVFSRTVVTLGIWIGPSLDGVENRRRRISMES